MKSKLLFIAYVGALLLMLALLAAGSAYRGFAIAFGSALVAIHIAGMLRLWAGPPEPVVAWQPPRADVPQPPGPSVPAEELFPESSTSPITPYTLSETYKGFEITITYYLYGDFVEDWSVCINDLFLHCLNVGSLHSPLLVLGLDVEDQHDSMTGLADGDGYVLLDAATVTSTADTQYGQVRRIPNTSRLLVVDSSYVSSQDAVPLQCVTTYVDFMIAQREANKFEAHLKRGATLFSDADDGS